jgi:hypothetical protein
VLCALWGCGGKAHYADTGPASGGSGGSGGGAATAGSGATAGEAESFPLDDSFPWFDASGASDFPLGGQDEVLHIAASGMPAQSTLSTHNVFDALSGASTIEFSAVASAPLRLLVCASNAIQPYDYFSARAAGQQWPVVPVEIGVDWQEYSVSLAEMMPPEVGDADGIPSFFLGFIVEHPTPVEVWLDEVRLTR